MSTNSSRDILKNIFKFAKVVNFSKKLGMDIQKEFFSIISEERNDSIVEIDFGTLRLTLLVTALEIFSGTGIKNSGLYNIQSLRDYYLQLISKIDVINLV